MTEFKDLRRGARAYVVVVVVAGAAVIAHSAHQLYVDPPGPQWFVLAALTLLTASFTVKVPAIAAYISVSETFVFASVLIFGASAGAITVLLECLVVLFWMKRGASIHKLLFNTAALAVAIWASGTVFFLFSGIEPYSKHAATLQQLFFPLLVFTVLYFLLNSWLIAIAVGFETKQSPLGIWWKNFIWLSINYWSGASVAALIVTYRTDVDYSREVDLRTLAVIVPLLVVSYLTSRVSMQRSEDTNTHLSEVNRLYLSTIETLAMAIDAKDQITHGHIRRVQAYAVALAKQLGVSEERLIKAIEAAALLHDMGKLAVPEYILNKPGKLTPAEFEKMKLHATVGADILSAIEFPYPVVPIVRHHHENWDGTGYPAGLKATEIPIGARILSVVDCFDALTSDRPYRPRLPDDEALRILIERRGNMYDPLIVDTFVRVHKEIAPHPMHVAVPSHALNEITGSSGTTVAIGHPQLDDIAAGADEMSTLYELARALAGQTGITATGDTIVKHLRRLIPFAQSALFLYDATADELVVQHAVGEASSTIKGVRVSLGQRLSGWVAANRQTILNSDPALDLGDAARTLEPRLRSSLSTPLIAENELVGVLTVYSTIQDGFSEEHRRVIGVVARQIGHAFKGMTEFESTATRDAVTGLPSLKQLERLVDATSGDNVSPRKGITLLLIDVLHLEDIYREHGKDAGDAALRSVVKQARAGLRSADVLFRCANDEFVALLNDATPETASAIASQILENIRACRLTSDSGEIVPIDVTVTPLVADQTSFNDRMAAARRRLHEQAADRQPASVH